MEASPACLRAFSAREAKYRKDEFKRLILWAKRQSPVEHGLQIFETNRVHGSKVHPGGSRLGPRRCACALAAGYEARSRDRAHRVRSGRRATGRQPPPPVAARLR